jgi:hypothetical protein
MNLHINSDNGHFYFGDFSISWGNALWELPGFFSIGYGNFNLEFGDIDQGRPGIYITTFADGDVESTRTLIQF